MSSKSLGPILFSALLVACGSVPKRTFEFRAIDTAEDPLNCLVVVGDNWDAARENMQLATTTNPLRLEIEFQRPTVEITVMQVTVDENGKAPNLPTSRLSPSEYRSDIRTLEVRDPTDQLFILERK